MDLGNIYQSLEFLNTRVMKTDFHISLYAFLLHFLVTFAIMRFLCVDVDGSAHILSHSGAFLFTYRKIRYVYLIFSVHCVRCGAY